ALSSAMLAILHLLGTFIANLFKSQRQLEVENLFLRHQLNIVLRGAPHRLRFPGSDRARKAYFFKNARTLLQLLQLLQLVKLFLENRSLPIFDDEIWSLRLSCTRCAWKMAGIFSPQKY